MRELFLRLDFDYKEKRIGHSLMSTGDIFDPAIHHVLHFQLDAIIKAIQTTVKELPE